MTLEDRARSAYQDMRTQQQAKVEQLVGKLLTDVLEYVTPPTVEPRPTVYCGHPAVEFELEGLRFRARPAGGGPILELIGDGPTLRIRSLADLGAKLAKGAQ